MSAAIYTIKPEAKYERPEDGTTREFCGLCGNIVRVGFHVPDYTWRRVVHPKHRDSIHCLDCFTKRADEKRIEWCKSIKFYPVSFKAFLNYVEPKLR